MQIQRGSVIEVERGYRRRRVPGSAMIDSMVVVWKHFQESFRKNRDFSDIHGTFTVEYPEERTKLPETYRNMPILLFDDETGHELCTSCFQCQRICPPQVIHMTQAKDPATGKAVPSVAEFVIEYDACMSCGFCAEVCPFDAIKMDHAFELSTDDHPGLTVFKQELNRPISYYASIAPTMWAEVKDGALKKLQGNIKRRPDVIGLAPHLAEKIAARRRELAAAAPPAAPATPAAAPATAPGRDAPATPGRDAPPGRLSPEEKAAKLAAMRAANAAKSDGAPAPVAEAPAPAPADDKAARLAAIRAKNAVKGEAPAPEAPAAPVDEKAARLAAIRAKNAAKGEAPAPVAEAPAAPVDEKAARLAAIRAKNAAALGSADAGEAPAPAAEATQGASPATPADEKAARLAAIRAANAARAGGSPDAAAATEPGRDAPPGRLDAAPPDAPAPPAVEGKAATPADEKAARLAAIRAANAAKKSGGEPGAGGL